MVTSAARAEAMGASAEVTRLATSAITNWVLTLRVNDLVRFTMLIPPNYFPS
jgi:hypothetical protein